MDMLRNITSGSAATSNPLLKMLLGPNASEADYKELAQEAERVWKHMDELSDSNPDGYQEFVRDAAKAAREDVERGRDPHVEDLSPALVLEAQAQQAAEAGSAAVRAGGGAVADVAHVVAGSRAVARVHIWAAKDASGVKPAYTAGGAAVTPQRAASLDWSGLVVPVAEYRPATSRPGPVPAHHFHVACHVSAVRMCTADQPPAFRAAFLEAVSQFVEAEYRLELSRTLRTLQVHREAVGEAELQVLVQRQEAHLRAQAGPADQADDEQADSAAGSSLPKGLLDELKTLGAPAAGAKQPKQQQPAAAAGGAAKTTKPLIEELD